MCKEGFKELAKILDENDIVHRTDLFGYYLNGEIDIHFTGFKSGNSIGIIDHFIDSLGYEKAARERVDGILDQQGVAP